MRALFTAALLLVLAPPSIARDATDLLGTWIGTGAENRGMTLVLAKDGAATLDGVARRWKAWGKNRIRYTLDGETVRGTYSVTQTKLVLTFEGVESPFRRQGGEKRQRAERTEREQRGSTDGAKVAGPPAKNALPAVPPALDGVARGRASRFDHPRGWFSFDMPDGWTIAEETEDGMLVNPGLRPQDTLDALILIAYGELDPGDRNVAPAELIERYSAEFSRSLRKEAIRLGKPSSPAEAVLVGAVPGGVKEWSATVDGGAKVGVWLGSIVKREYYLSVSAVIVDGQAERFLPRIKRIFFSLEARPPERNPKLERLLAGRSVGMSSVDASGSFSVSYDFHSGGGVRSFTAMSGSPSDATPVSMSDEQTGSYEVVGDVVYIYLGSGQESGVVELEGGELIGVRFGDRLYHAR